MIGSVAYGRRAGRPRTPDEIAAKRARVINVWRSGDCTRASPAERYFVRRGLPWLVECKWLRFHPNCPHPATDEHGCWRGLYAPAVIATLLDPGDYPAGIQKIFITPDGNEAKLEPRRITAGHVAGNAVHLHMAAHQIVVAERLETAASAAVLFERPAWAACGDGNLACSMRLPALPLASDVMIACDHDSPGKQAAEAAAARWRKEGRKVEITSPLRLGTDFEDVPLAERHRP